MAEKEVPDHRKDVCEPSWPLETANGNTPLSPTTTNDPTMKTRRQSQSFRHEMVSPRELMYHKKTLWEEAPTSSNPDDDDEYDDDAFEPEVRSSSAVQTLLWVGVRAHTLACGVSRPRPTRQLHLERQCRRRR